MDPAPAPLRSSQRRPRSAAWPIAAASLWMASIGNYPLWIALERQGSLQGWSGRAFAVAFGLAIAGLLATLISLLAWRYTLKPVLVVLLFATALGAHFMHSFGVVIDPAMMTNVMLTDTREMAELTSPGLLGTVAGLCVLPAILIWRWPVRYGRWARQLLHNAAVFVTGAAVLVGAVLAAYQPMASTMRNTRKVRYLVNPVNSIYALGTLAVAPFKPAARVFKIAGEDAELGPTYKDQVRPPLLVLVFGETARGDHFSLNGYERDTNPELAKEDIVSFHDVRSCGTSTATSLRCMVSHLGRDEYDRRDANYENLLELLQRIGIALLWMDNQYSCKGVCDQVPFVHTWALQDPTLCPDGECLDMIMLKDLDAQVASLPEEARRRGIVLMMHQMGSHGPAYFKRSPPEYKRFLPECTTAVLQNCNREELVNAYDNSIAYTDHVLASIIHWLQEREDRYDGGLLYISDHGESLGEGNLYLHGLPYAIAPVSQKHVAWIQWTSPGLARRSGLDTSCMRGLADVPVTHDNLFHTVLGLLDVKTRIYRRDWDAYAACASARP